MRNNKIILQVSSNTPAYLKLNLTVEWRIVELELYRLVLVDSTSACIKELAGGLQKKISSFNSQLTKSANLLNEKKSQTVTDEALVAVYKQQQEVGNLYHSLV